MTRATLYSQSKQVAQQLGYDIKQITSKYRKSTQQFWSNKLNQLNRQLTTRDAKYNEALKLSRELRTPLIINKSKSSIKDWVNEIKRIRKTKKEQVAWMNKIDPILKQLVESKEIRQQTKDKNKLLNLIDNNDYQAIFNNVINKNITLSENQAETIVARMRAGGRYVIHITGTDGLNQYLTVNDNTADFIVYILENGIIESKGGEVFGSDILEEIIIQSITNITVSLLSPKKTVNNKVKRIFDNKASKFFPHINTTSIDLSRYQIYNQKQAYADTTHSTREHCLLYTLSQQGIIPSIINSIKLQYVAGTHIHKKDLHQISNIINRNINVYTINNDKIKKQQIKADEPEKDKLDIEISIYECHYFTYEKTIYSNYSINHYDQIKDKEDFNNIIKRVVKKNKVYYKKDVDNFKSNSLSLVHKFLKQDKFKVLDMIKFDEASSNIKTRDVIYLDNIENEQQEFKKKEEKEEAQPVVFYADCESFVKNVENHELYLLGCVSDKKDRVEIFNIFDNIFDGAENKKKPTTREQLLVYEWLKVMTNRGRNKKVLCYYHNLKYDYHILEKYLNIRDKCQKDGQLYSVKCSYEKCEIELRDSFKLCAFPLAKFPKEFELDNEYKKKEAIAYEYYTRENNDRVINTDIYRDMLSNTQKLIFDELVIKCPSFKRTNKGISTFNPLTWYKEYLRLDCLVLKKGLQKFETLIKEITEGKMSIYNYLTISSLTDNYMKIEGAYDETYEIKGNLRAYCAEAVYGGRVCVNQKYQKQLIEDEISDYDGVSLYPSAINRVCREIGLPKGKAKRLINFNNWKNTTYSILTVKILKVNKIQQMPFIAVKTDKGSIDYTNNPPKDHIFIIDKLTLEDYINFHHIEYEIIDGVYWNEGGNKKMGEVVQRLFNARLKAKKEKKEALSGIIKLMLNSSYGKTIMKKSKTKKIIVNIDKKTYDKKNDIWNTEEKVTLDNYIYNNFHTIKEYRQINKNQYEFEQIKADDSYNRGHIGCIILSMSKRIMNEVFNVANDNDIIIYYTDTDSMHCKRADVKKLQDKYRDVYNKELDGENLEQFHSDFELKGSYINEDDSSQNAEVYAIKSIFLGKKSYMDCLESVDKNGKIVHGFHIRLKGITKAGLEHEAKKYDDSYLGLYKELATGAKLNMVLNPFNKDENEQKVLFEFKNGNVSTRTQFIRQVKF